MQLSLFTDLSIRTLLALARSARDGGRLTTIAELASAFNCSENHLVKVVHNLSKLGWVNSYRGKGGGIELSRPASEYNFGGILRTLEGSSDIVDCVRVHCPYFQGCKVRVAFSGAREAFFDYLSRWTLADML